MIYSFFARFGILLLAASISLSFVPVSFAASTVSVQNKSVTTYEDIASKSITLSALGSHGETYSFSIPQLPLHGTLSLNGNTVTYVPVANFHGTDFFQYQAYGSVNGWSNIATVTLTVSARNDAPVAVSGLAVTTDQDTPVSFTGGGTDVDGDVLFCFTGITSGGTSAAEAGTCIITFTPYAGFVGTATVNIRVFDGNAYSKYVAIPVTVLKVNQAPVSADVAKTLYEDMSATVLLDATDANLDSLSYQIVSPPQHGTATVSGSSVAYTPEPNFNGTDQFTYSAHDGTIGSNVAVASVSVSPVNDPPDLLDVSYEMDKNQRLSITFSGTDVDGDSLTFGVSRMPAHGHLEYRSTGAIDYVPEEDFTGIDTFEYWVSDGMAYPKATVTIQVNESSVEPSVGVGQIAWQYDFVNAVISGAPAFDDENRIYAGSFEQATEVYVMDADGQLLDRLDTGMHVESSPMILGDRLVMNTLGVVASVSGDPGSNVLGGVTLADRLGTMSLGLQADGTFDLDRIWGNRSLMHGRDGSPGRNEDGTIVYAADVFHPEKHPDWTPFLTAMDAATGATLQAIPMPGWTYSSPLFDPDDSTSSQKDGLVVVGSEVPDQDPLTGGFQGLGGTGLLMAYRSNEQGVLTETSAWTVASASPFNRGVSTATINGKRLYFTGTQNGMFYGIDSEDGSIVWSRNTGGTGFGTLTVGHDNRTVYAVTGTSSGEAIDNPIYASLIAIDGETGTVLWTHTISNKGAVAVVGDRGIYVVGKDEVLAVDEHGQELWSLALGNDLPFYGYASLMPETGLLVFGAGTTMMAVQTESTGPSMISSWPSYRATPDNGGIPQ